jgi:hypothetical protein
MRSTADDTPVECLSVSLFPAQRSPPVTETSAGKMIGTTLPGGREHLYLVAGEPRPKLGEDAQEGLWRMAWASPRDLGDFGQASVI